MRVSRLFRRQHVGEAQGERAVFGLLAQPVEEVLELPARLGRHELVLLQPPHLAGEVVGHHVELQVALLGDTLRDVLAPLVTRLPRVAQVLVERVALAGTQQVDGGDLVLVLTPASDPAQD